MSKRLTNIFLVLVLLTTSSTSGYANTIDSLKSLLGDENDTSNYRVYRELGEIYRDIIIDSALYFDQLGLDQAKKENDKINMSKFHNNIGANYFYKGWKTLAIKHFELATKIDKNIGDTTNYIISMNNLGNANRCIGRYEEAYNILYNALYQAEFINDIHMLSILNSNIGALFAELKYYNKALLYYRKAVGLSQSINYHKAIADNYLRIGFLFQETNNIDSAIYYYSLSIDKYQQINNPFGIIDNLGNLGSSFLRKKNYPLALNYFNQALELCSITGSNMGEIHEYFGDYYSHIGNNKKSMEYYNYALNLYKENGNKTILQDVYKKISKTYKVNNNYDSALFYYELYTIHKDSIFNLEKSKQIAELETIYQTEKKEKEIIQLEKEKEKKQSQLLLLSGFIALLIMLVVFTYIYYKTRQKSLVLKAITSEQKKQFKAVLGAQENERKRIAAELHDSVGPLLSVSQLYISELGESGNQPETESKQLCNKSLNALKEATQEIRDISHNLMPGVLVRIGLGAACRELIRKINETKNHTISFEVIGYKKRLDETIELTFYRIFQELLNNILKHSKANKVEVNLLQKNSTLSLTVKDNGIGFNTKNMDKAKGIGLQSIYSRISLIGGEVEIDSGNNGTTTIVSAPI